jgi:hypothetical protein
MLPYPSFFQALEAVPPSPDVSLEEAVPKDVDRDELSLRPPSCSWRVFNANKNSRAFSRSPSRNDVLASRPTTFFSNSFFSK